MENTETQTTEASLESLIEALLFWRGEPVSIKDLAADLGQKTEAIEEALSALEKTYKAGGRGLTVVYQGENAKKEVMLGTSPAAGTLIEKLTKEALTKDLGKAALETLAIILYKGPVRRSEVDHIRGVNSSFIIRNLLVRGLVLKQPAPGDNRTNVYSTSVELLSYLGISKPEDMPNFEQVQSEIALFEQNSTEPIESTESKPAESTTEHGETLA